MIYYISGNPVLSTRPPETMFVRPALMMTYFDARQKKHKTRKRFKAHVKQRRRKAERWKPIPGFEDIYEASTYGRIRSIRRKHHNGRQWFSGKVLKPTVNSRTGYLWVTLAGRNFAVHRLILQTFVGPRPDGYEARHFPDQDKTNNHLNNLRWDTSSGNKRDRIANKTDPRGERNGRAILTPNKVRSIKRKYATGKTSLSRLGKLYGVSPTTIHRIVRGESWSHLSEKENQ